MYHQMKEIVWSWSILMSQIVLSIGKHLSPPFVTFYLDPLQANSYLRSSYQLLNVIGLSLL
jgi:hypothetical protein